MNEITIKVRKHHEEAKVNKAYKYDAGIDLFSIENVMLEPGKIYKVPTGISIEIPPGYVGIVKERSSFAIKNIDVKAGVIDSGYRGEVIVVMRNMGERTFFISKGDKIAQLLILEIPETKIEYTNELSDSERGDKGFGSSDMK